MDVEDLLDLPVGSVVSATDEDGDVEFLMRTGDEYNLDFVGAFGPTEVSAAQLVARGDITIEVLFEA